MKSDCFVCDLVS